MNFKITFTLLLIHFSTYCYSQVYLGITYIEAPINAQYKNDNPSQKIVFLNIIKVANNSPAQKAGILIGDFICSVNKKDIVSKDEFQKYIFGLQANDVVSLLIKRGNNSFYKEVVLERMSSDYKAQIEKQENEINKELDYINAWKEMDKIKSKGNTTEDLKEYRLILNKLLDIKPRDYKTRLFRVATNTSLGNYEDAKKDIEYILINNRHELSHTHLKYIYSTKMYCDYFLNENSNFVEKQNIISKGIKDYLSILNESDKDLKIKINSLNKNIVSKCNICDGSGRTNHPERCPNCLNWNNEYKRKVPCHVCKDTRYVKHPNGQKCFSCNGTGINKKSQSEKNSEMFYYIVETDSKNYSHK